MVKSDRQQFAEALAILFMTFGKELDDGRLRAYWAALMDLPIEQVKHGIESCLHECHFLPVPAEIRSRCGALNPEMRAELAWDTVLTAVRQRGGSRSVFFEDAHTSAVLRRLGGWPTVSGAESHELTTWIRKRFLDSYLLSLRHEAASVEAEVLPGLLEGKPITVEASYLPAEDRARLQGPASFKFIDHLTDGIAKPME